MSTARDCACLFLNTSKFARFFVFMQESFALWNRPVGG